MDHCLKDHTRRLTSEYTWPNLQLQSMLPIEIHSLRVSMQCDSRHELVRLHSKDEDLLEDPAYKKMKHSPTARVKTRNLLSPEETGAERPPLQQTASISLPFILHSPTNLQPPKNPQRRHPSSTNCLCNRVTHPPTSKGAGQDPEPTARYNRFLGEGLHSLCTMYCPNFPY